MGATSMRGSMAHGWERTNLKEVDPVTCQLAASPCKLFSSHTRDSSMPRFQFPCLLALVLSAATFSSAQAPATGQKRPMTFEDMMQMKRLGETAVSPDGKWLAYSVTSINLEQNTKTTGLWLQKIEGGETKKISVAKT